MGIHTSYITAIYIGTDALGKGDARLGKGDVHLGMGMVALDVTREHSTIMGFIQIT